MQKQNIFTILLFISLFALPAHASDCARMERKWPWEPGQEVKYECNKIAKMTLSWIKKDELPDIKQLLQADIISSEIILGRPFHCYPKSRYLHVFLYDRGQKKEVLLECTDVLKYLWH